MTGEHLVLPTTKDRAFAELALRQGLLETEQLRQAQASQAEMEHFGISKALAAIVIDKGLAQKEAVSAAMDELQAFFIRCQACKEENPLSNCDRHGNLQCGRCGEPVSLPEGRISEDDLAPSVATGAGGGDARRQKRDPGRGKKAEKVSGAPPGAAQIQPSSCSDGAARPHRKPERRQGSGTMVRNKAFSPVFTDSLAFPQEITKFEIEKLIGVSPAGKLYLVRDAGNPTALKVLDQALCANKNQLKKWVEFMQRVQDLPRSATLKPVQLHREGSANYVVRPYLGGPLGSLKERLASRSDDLLKVSSIQQLALGIVNSLWVFHSVHLVHGNLKPGNVIFAQEGIRLADPGIHLFTMGLSPEDRLLRLWQDARYQAPEVLHGNEPSAASDVFSAGRMLQDAFKLLPTTATSAEAECMGRLRELAERMTAADPSDRYPSAREVLRDLQKSHDETRQQQKPPPRRRLRLDGRAILSRTMRLSVMGPLALALVLTLFGYQTLSYVATRSAMASSSHADEVSDQLISRQIRDLSRWTAANSSEVLIAQNNWKRLENIFQGSPWEPRIRRAAMESLQKLRVPREQDFRAAFAEIQAAVDQGKWFPALKALLAIGEAIDKDSEGRTLRERVLEGMYRTHNLLYIPGGEVRASGKRGEHDFVIGPFLADASLANRKIYKVFRVAKKDGARDPGDAEKEHLPLVDIDFSEAEELAEFLGKRLPTGSEWDRLASLSPSASAWEAFAAERIKDLGGSLFQWVKEEATDSLCRVGYGCCRGGDRAGVPVTHPLRRKKSSGYPDVGVRFVMNLQQNPAK